jgi:hypothetical protein
VVNSPRIEAGFATDGQSASLSWCLSPELDFLMFDTYFVVHEGTLSGERTGLQFAVQSLIGPSRTEPVTRLYGLI